MLHLVTMRNELGRYETFKVDEAFGAPDRQRAWTCHLMMRTQPSDSLHTNYLDTFASSMMTE